MSILSRWFKKTEPEDYEQVLATLADDIQKRETRLSEIRLRERRTSLLFTIYALAFWGGYISLWYTNLLPNISGRPRSSQFGKVIQGVPIILGPIIILFMRRIVQIWYTRIGNAEENTLKTLRKQQRGKVEEIKKRTNYYSTRNLIERYDDAPNGDSPLRRRNAPVQSPVTPQHPPPPQGKFKTPIGQALQSHMAPTPAPPMTPPRKQWYDKLADAILGDDELSSATPASRYALICEKCFNHNGLVKESIWEDAQYVCPKCGHFNASARSKKSGSPHSPPSHLSGSPLSSPTQPRHTSFVSDSNSFAPPLAEPVGMRGPSPAHSASHAGAGDGSPVSGYDAHVDARRDPNAASEGNSIRMEVDSYT